MSQLPVLVHRLDPDLPLPGYARPGDAGLDLYARIDVTLAPGERALIPTGIAIALPAAIALAGLWLIFWLWLYRRPAEHPRITDKEREYLAANIAAAAPVPEAGAAAGEDQGGRKPPGDHGRNRRRGKPRSS